MPGNLWRKFFSSLTFLLVVSFSSTSFFAVAESDQLVTTSPAQLLLQRMVDAHQQLSYKGRFTYEHGGILRTMEVDHQVQDGLAVERLVHLNGPKREMIRQQGESDCRNSGEILLRGMLLDIGAGGYSRLTDNYQLLLKGQDRVAGRAVDVLHLVPKDKYRYGYSLAVDRGTGLLMQSLLIDSGKKVLERFQFIYLEVGAGPDEVNAQPVEYAQALSTGPCIDDAQKKAINKRLKITWLPPGFALSGYQSAPDQQAETLVFTDGLAVFSLFVESEGQQPLPEVQAQRGATVAFLMRTQQVDKNYRVCVVGEIPSATARRVAQSLTIGQ